MEATTTTTVRDASGALLVLDTRTPAATFVTLPCGTVLACERDGSEVIGAACADRAYGWKPRFNAYGDALYAVRTHHIATTHPVESVRREARRLLAGGAA